MYFQKCIQLGNFSISQFHGSLLDELWQLFNILQLIIFRISFHSIHTSFSRSFHCTKHCTMGYFALIRLIFWQFYWTYFGPISTVSWYFCTFLRPFLAPLDPFRTIFWPSSLFLVPRNLPEKWAKLMQNNPLCTLQTFKLN